MTTRRSPIPYGSWPSPITPERLSQQVLRLSSCALAKGSRYWLEGRAAERGRNVLVRKSADARVVDMTPPPYDVRSRVHEYGGNPYVVADSTIWFVNFRDQQIYVQTENEAPQALTAQVNERFTDMILDLKRQRIICVAESHAIPGREPENFLTSVDLRSGELRRLCTGEDFFSNPVLSPDGMKLAWLSWRHPNMPWDETTLWVGEINHEGEIANHRVLAGGEQISIFQPQWSPEGMLYYISDKTQWWNLYCTDLFSHREVCAIERDFGRGQWQFGMRTYGFMSKSRLLASYVKGGQWCLGEIDTIQGTLRSISTDLTDFDSIQVDGSRLLCVASGVKTPTSIVEMAIETGDTEIHQVSNPVGFAREYLSIPQPITYPTSAGHEAHGFFYPPYNKDCTGPADELPPLLVIGHGGPTSATSTGLNLALQFWTSHGFGVLDVNYRGSIGYGREYRDLLRGQWGVYDVEDCVYGALALAELGKVDRTRLAIRGSSAGGYTALAALTFHDVFSAGASYYGISELETLAKETHKFESHYLDSLIGPYPECRELYIARSPIHFTAQFTCPIIFFQGLRDEIVPPKQAEIMVNALRNKGLSVTYHTFPDEGHGFRAAETIKQTLEAELAFYGQTWGFIPARA